jgi:hypothetical protein
MIVSCPGNDGACSYSVDGYCTAEHVQIESLVGGGMVCTTPTPEEFAAENGPDTVEEIDMSHGSPYDRGGSDSYYHRPRKPHYSLDSCHIERVEEADMTEEEIRQYHLGYDDNEASGDKKNWD